jgi:hypothetical protein
LERGPQDSSYSESVSAESFIDAIKDFQSFAGLKKTGKVIETVPALTFAFRPYFNNKSIMNKEKMFSKIDSKVNLTRRHWK